MGGKPTVRTLDRGYPFITENGNLCTKNSIAC